MFLDCILQIYLKEGPDSFILSTQSQGQFPKRKVINRFQAPLVSYSGAQLSINNAYLM